MPSLLLANCITCYILAVLACIIVPLALYTCSMYHNAIFLLLLVVIYPTLVFFSLLQVTCGSTPFTSQTTIKTPPTWTLTVTKQSTCLPSGPPRCFTSSSVSSSSLAAVSCAAFTCVAELTLTIRDHRVMIKQEC